MIESQRRVGKQSKREEEVCSKKRKEEEVDETLNFKIQWGD